MSAAIAGSTIPDGKDYSNALLVRVNSTNGDLLDSDVYEINDNVTRARSIVSLADGFALAGITRLLLNRIAEHLKPFPGYIKIRHVEIIEAPWSVENGLMTPTLKLKRGRIIYHYRDTIDRIYRHP